MVYGYIRVSSDKQTVENQRYEINQFCSKEHLHIDDWIEETIRGSKEYKKRELGKLLRKVKQGDAEQVVVDKILNYAFANYTDVQYSKSEKAVRFTYNGLKPPGLTVDVGNTGITYEIENITGNAERGYAFLGNDISKWGSIERWKCINSPDDTENITLFSVYKGLVEYLLKHFPTAYIVWVIPKTFSFDFMEKYKRDDGTRDIDAILQDIHLQYGSYVFQGQIEFCEYFGIPYIDLRKKSCLNPCNIEIYMNNNDVHPKDVAYQRWGDIIAKELN